MTAVTGKSSRVESIAARQIQGRSLMINSNGAVAFKEHNNKRAILKQQHQQEHCKLTSTKNRRVYLEYLLTRVHLFYMCELGRKKKHIRAARTGPPRKSGNRKPSYLLLLDNYLGIY